MLNNRPPSGIYLNPVDYEELSIGAAPSGLTPSKAANCEAVLVRFESGPIRYLLIGTPTSTVGMPRYNGDEEVFSSFEAKNLLMIRIGTTNGTIRATYYRMYE